MADLGRGAWTTNGMSNGTLTRYYEYRTSPGWVMQGSEPTKGPAFQAVNFAIQAIQIRCHDLLFPTTVATGIDGVFGSKTAAAVRAAQLRLGLTSDGIIGPNTTKALWRPLLVTKGKITSTIQCGLVGQESAWDPAAIGFYTPQDTGLVQINRNAHPEVTLAQAFDPRFAFPWMVSYLTQALVKYPLLDAAIASYNSPRSAAAWQLNGRPPNSTIALYVQHVKSGCPL
jgi:hypothetical protein